MKYAVIALLLVFGALLPARAEENITNPSGLPIPRFVSLKSDEVNARSGPGMRYPIQWVYRKENLPVEVIEEFDHWRKIRDFNGETGWVHKGMTDGRRYAIVREDVVVLRDDPKLDSAPMVRVSQGVVARLLACEAEWCRLQVAGHKGWTKKDSIWGIYKDEKFD